MRPLASLLTLIAITIVPAVVLADEVLPDPATDEPVVDPALPEAPVASPAETPIAAPAAQPIAENPCAWHRAGGSRPSGRFAIGIAHGHLTLDDDRDGSQKSLLARVALHHGMEVELELAHAEIAGDDTRTAGGALLHVFGHHHLRPYVVVGAGGGRLERADGNESHLRYAELGGGLMLRKRHLAIGIDVRRGIRHVDDDSAPMDVSARMVATDADHEHYMRGRVLAMVYF
jgi:hypothetical protein